VTRATAPFLVPLVTVLGLITVFPELVLFLPRLMLGP
jgi:TRAP-type C4-dicarboxylate transport system permease large subunit